MTAGEHPGPTPSTVKRLYALAFRCAHPDCPRPLYTQNNETGDLVLNSRIAHIHARSPGGPRWIEMSAEDNRAEANLLLLCIEHSYEIDEVPERYPADLLREWKRAQLDEYERVQRGWPLNDAEAAEVLQESSSAAVEHHHAGAVLGAVRAAERLSLAARRARLGPAAAAASWRAMRARTRAQYLITDADGNRLDVEPSHLETAQYRAALVTALNDAASSLAQGSDDAKVELAAIRAIRPALEPWSAWACLAVDEVITASSTWPEPPSLEDDDRLERALTNLAAATAAITAKWRGEETAPPPAAPTPEPPRSPDPLREHRALLEQARPFARVDHRAYEPALREELAAAAERATSVPPVPSAMAIDLVATCRLAAAVAGNADDNELAVLADRDARRRPLSAAVLLLAEAAKVASERGRPGPEERAKATLVALWDSIDWSDPSSWDSDDVNGHRMFWVASRATSPAHVQERLTQALRQRPELVLPLVAACAEWVEQRASYDFNVLLGIGPRYHQIAPWFPINAVVAAADSVAPEYASVTVNAFGETEGGDALSLLAQVVWLASRSAPSSTASEPQRNGDDL